MNENDGISRIDKESKKIISLLTNKKTNYIFGSGWMGKKFLSAVNALGLTIDGFVVTNKTAESVDGISVFVLNEMEGRMNRANIFVALRDQDVKLNVHLSQIFSNVYPITYPGDITVIEAKYYLDYFRQKNIACNSQHMELGDFTFVNPFLKADDYLLSWVYEAGDLILPNIFHDYSRVDEGPYETESTALKEGDVVLDCGANIGIFSNVAVQKGCMVYAFEPMPDAISYLGELEQDSCGKMEICPYALSDSCGQAVFHVQNFDLLGASLLVNNNSIDREIEIELLTIDAFVEKRKLTSVDFIKADIEGSERDMLHGAAKTIKKFRPNISVCTYHLSDDKEVLENIIKNIDPSYVIEHRWKKLYAYVPEDLK